MVLPSILDLAPPPLVISSTSSKWLTCSFQSGFHLFRVEQKPQISSALVAEGITGKDQVKNGNFLKKAKALYDALPEGVRKVYDERSKQGRPKPSLMLPPVPGTMGGVEQRRLKFSQQWHAMLHTMKQIHQETGMKMALLAFEPELIGNPMAFSTPGMETLINDPLILQCTKLTVEDAKFRPSQMFQMMKKASPRHQMVRQIRSLLVHVSGWAKLPKSGAFNIHEHHCGAVGREGKFVAFPLSEWVNPYDLKLEQCKQFYADDAQETLLNIQFALKH
jgi:hypothetical protein